jgi:hypothetical protein
LQERGLRIVFQDNTSEYSTLLKLANLKTLHESRLQGLVTEVYKARAGLTPIYIKDFFKEKDSDYNLHNQELLHLRKCRTTTYGINSFSYKGSSLWNKLPNSTRLARDIDSFKTELLNVDLISLNSRIGQ